MSGSQATFDTMVAAMSGQNSLNNWDCLVSYDLKKINDLLTLQASSATSGLSSSLKFSLPINVLGEDCIENIDATLGTPVLEILSNSADVSITFPISGNGTVKKPKQPDFQYQEAIPNDIVLVVKTSLKNVQGEVSASSPQTSSQNDVVQLDQSKTVQNSVCIDFKNIDSVSLKAASKSSGDPMDKMQHIMIQFQAALQTHLDEVGMKCSLASVSNKFETNDASSVLFRPTKFCFTTCIGSVGSDTPGALSMWIAVQGGSGGGSSIATFSPGSSTINPLPQGSSAAMVISHDIMAKIFFEPELIRNGLTNVKTTSQHGTSGMEMEGTLKSAECKVEAKDEHDFYSQSHYDGVTFNVDDPCVKFKIEPCRVTDDTAAMSIDWSSNTYRLGWETTIATPGGPANSGSGTVDAQFAFQGNGKWSSGQNTDLLPNALNFTITFDKEFTTTMNGEDVGGWSRIFGGTSQVPKQYIGLSLAVPKIAIELKPLNYFLLTNLLFPGQRIFVPDSIPGQKGSIGGIATPRDTIFTGQLVEKIKPSLVAFDGFANSGLESESPQQKDGRRLIKDLTSPPAVPISRELLTILTTQGAAKERNALILAKLKKHDYGDDPSQGLLTIYGHKLDSFLDSIHDRISLPTSLDQANGTTRFSSPVELPVHDTPGESVDLAHTLERESKPAVPADRSELPKPVNLTREKSPGRTSPSDTVMSEGATNGADAAATEFDLSVYTAIYKFTNQEDKGELFVVFPFAEKSATGKTKVKCDGQDVEASNLATESDGLHKVAWKTSKGDFEAHFSTNIDTTGERVVFEFTGSRVETGGLTGSTAKTTTIGGKQSFESLESLESSSSGIDIGGLVLGCLGIVVGVIVAGVQDFLARRREKLEKSNNAADRAELSKIKDIQNKLDLLETTHLKAVEATAQHNDKAFKRSCDRLARRTLTLDKYKTFLKNKTSNIVDGLKDRVNVSLENQIKNLQITDATLGEYLNAVRNGTSEPTVIKQLLDQVSTTIREEITTNMNEGLKIDMEKALAKNPYASLYDDKQLQEQILSSVSDLDSVKNVRDKLTVAGGSSLSCVEGYASALLLQRASNTADQVSKSLKGELAKADQQRGQTVQEKLEAEDAMKEFEKTYDPLDDKKVERKAELQKIVDEKIEAEKKATKEADAKSSEYAAEATKAHEGKTEAEKREKESNHAAKEVEKSVRGE